MVMNSQEIQESVYNYLMGRSDLNAPYGVLTGNRKTRMGRNVRTVTFGRARTLDATVEIYNRNYMFLRTSRGSELYRNHEELMSALEKI
jgi:hypothetical protein